MAKNSSAVRVPHPTPYTLHPTPYTLHPTPHTLHPSGHLPWSCSMLQGYLGANDSEELVSVEGPRSAALLGGPVRKMRCQPV